MQCDPSCPCPNDGSGKGKGKGKGTLGLFARFVALLLAACAPAPEHASHECKDDGVVQALAEQPAAAVILVLRDVAAQDGVLRELGSDFELGRRYQSTPALAGNLTRAGFERARTLDAVRCVQLDGTGSGV